MAGEWTNLGNPRKSNIKRFNERRDLMDDCRGRDPTAQLRWTGRLEELPAVPEDDCVLAKATWRNKGNTLEVSLRKKNDMHGRGEAATLVFPLPARLSQSTADTIASTAERICEHVILNAQDPWSVNTIIAGGRLGREAVINATMRGAYGKLGQPPAYIRLVAPSYASRRQRIRIHVRRIDPGSPHETMLSRAWVYARRIAAGVTVPRVTNSNISWTKGILPGSEIVEDLEDVRRLPTSIPDKERESQRRAMRLASHVTELLDGCIGSDSEVRYILNSFVNSYYEAKDEKDVNRRTYNRGGRWVSIVRDPARKRTALRVSRFMGQWENIVPRIFIRSDLPSRAYRSADALIRLCEAKSHFLDAWEAAALEADEENRRIEDGIDAPDPDPSEPMQPLSTCVCRGCTRQIVFAATVKHPDLGLTCLFCGSLSKEEIERLRIANSQPRLFFNLSSLIRKDYVIRGTVGPHTKAERIRVLAEQRRQLQKFKILTPGEHSEVSWKDGYCDMFPGGIPDRDRRYVTSGTNLSPRSPFQASTEAHHPVAEDVPTVLEDGNVGHIRDTITWHHAVGNLLVTTWSLNIMKFCSPAVVLKAMAQYRNGQTSEELDHAFQGLMNILLIDSAGPVHIRQTWPAAMSQPEIGQLKKAWHGGRLQRLPLASELTSVLKMGVPPGLWNRPHTSWRPSKALMRRYSEIPAMYGFSAGSADFSSGYQHDDRLWCTLDGQGNRVPYPFDPRSKHLVVWSWRRLHVWMLTRWEMMRDACNARWATDSDVNTFQLSLMHSHFQHLVSDREALQEQRKSDPALPNRDPIPRDMFGFCPAPWRGGPAAASVAHDHHDSAMNVGYGGNLDLEAEEFVYVKALCNLSLDTRACNFSIQDFDESLRGKIAKQLDHLRVDDAEHWEPGKLRWADKNWIDEGSLDPEDCVRLAKLLAGDVAKFEDDVMRNGRYPDTEFLDDDEFDERESSEEDESQDSGSDGESDDED